MGSRNYLTCCLLLGASLVACAQPQQNDVQESDAENGEARSDAHAPSGKPTAPVKITFDLSKAPTIGVPVLANVSIIPTANVDRMTVEFAVSEGLDFLPFAIDLPAQALGALTKRQMRVTPKGEGRHFLRVFAATWIGEQKRIKVAMYPVDIGNVTSNSSHQPNGTVKSTSTGEKVISMPASDPPPQK